MNAYWDGNDFCLGNVVVGRVLEFDDEVVAVTKLPWKGGSLLGRFPNRERACEEVENFARVWIGEIRK